jgi:hypothetical protein
MLSVLLKDIVNGVLRSVCDKDKEPKKEPVVEDHVESPGSGNSFCSKHKNTPRATKIREKRSAEKCPICYSKQTYKSKKRKRSKYEQNIDSSNNSGSSESSSPEDLPSSSTRSSGPRARKPRKISLKHLLQTLSKITFSSKEFELLQAFLVDIHPTFPDDDIVSGKIGREIVSMIGVPAVQLPDCDELIRHWRMLTQSDENPSTVTESTPVLDASQSSSSSSTESSPSSSAESSSVVASVMSAETTSPTVAASVVPTETTSPTVAELEIRHGPMSTPGPPNPDNDDSKNPNGKIFRKDVSKK